MKVKVDLVWPFKGSESWVKGSASCTIIYPKYCGWSGATAGLCYYLLARSTPWILSCVLRGTTAVQFDFVCLLVWGKKKGRSSACEYGWGVSDWEGRNCEGFFFFFFLREGGEGERWVRHFWDSHKALKSGPGPGSLSGHIQSCQLASRLCPLHPPPSYHPLPLHP